MLRCEVYFDIFGVDHECDIQRNGRTDSLTANATLTYTVRGQQKG